jgi:hypothetical protein
VSDIWMDKVLDVSDILMDKELDVSWIVFTISFFNIFDKLALEDDIKMLTRSGV